MNKILEFETYLSISKTKFGIYLFDTKNRNNNGYPTNINKIDVGFEDRHSAEWLTLRSILLKDERGINRTNDFVSRVEALETHLTPSWGATTDLNKLKNLSEGFIHSNRMRNNALIRYHLNKY